MFFGCVVIEFPFSDLINSKKRPMLILAEKENDIIGCAITSNPESEGILINEFTEGSLPFVSKVKYWQIHTFMKELVIRKVARISKTNYQTIADKISKMFSP